MGSHTFLRFRAIGSVAVALAVSHPLMAQTGDTATLSPVVISATKTPLSRTSLTQAVTVITGEELRSKGLTRVTDVLRSVAGAAIVQNGSHGSVSTLFLRGGESRYTKVVIDGVAVNAPGGFFDFSHLTTDNIERIEIVRGPASVVYGADAVSGIVRIFTRQGKGPLALRADARAGTYGTREAALEAAGSAGKARYSIGGGARRTDGVLDFNNQYYNGTLSGSAGFAPGSGSDALLTARYTAAEFHYPTDYTGAPVDSNAYRVQHRLTVGLDARARLADSLTGRLSLGTNEVSDLTEDIAVPFGSVTPRRSAFMSRNKRRAAEAGFLVRFPDAATLNIGGEYLRERESSVNEEGPVGAPASPTSRFAAQRDNKAIYAELLSAVTGGASFTFAVRRDDNSDYDAFTTYRVGTSFPFGPSARLRASLSTAFNAPAFNQIRPTLYTVGSPDLDPERTRSWEVGAEQIYADGTVRVSGSWFNQRFMDLIQFVSGGPPAFLGSYANLTEAQANGFEFELTMKPGAEWSAAATYTQVKPRVTKVSSDYSGDLEAGDALLRRPERSGTASITWTPDASSSLALIATYVGERPDLDFVQFPSPVVTLPAYTRLDIAASRVLLRTAAGRTSLAFTTRVENALDRRYEDVLHFPAPGRTVLLGARYSGGF